MRYIGLAYFDPARFAALPAAERQAIVTQCPALDEKMRATGKMRLSASLGDVEHWVSLRPRGGTTQVTDGPYTEAKEMVGGLFIIEAADRDEAIRLASMHPAARIGEAGGWGVELIPLDFYLEC